jgi:hypothetical protein
VSGSFFIGLLKTVPQHYQMRCWGRGIHVCPYSLGFSDIFFPAHNLPESSQFRAKVQVRVMLRTELLDVIFITDVRAINDDGFD